jgi:hypothetical protein
MKDKKQHPSCQIPPTTFNVIDRAFQPTTLLNYKPNEITRKKLNELHETVMKLEAAGRFRSALKEIIAFLENDPDNPSVLVMAMTTIGASYGNKFGCEPLTPSDLSDIRLDPIFTVCSNCGNEWVSHSSAMTPFIESKISQEIHPMQCRDCGYVLCRVCIFERLMPSDSTRDGSLARLPACPNCGEQSLVDPAFPTGRLPRQTKRQQPEKIVITIVFREGSIPPDIEYVTEILELTAPDVLESGATFKAFPIFPWPADIEEIAIDKILHMQYEGEISSQIAYELETWRGRDLHNVQLCVVKVLRQ